MHVTWFMVCRLSMKVLAAALVAGTVVFSSGAARSQDVDLKSLLQRIERLEKQNEELRARLNTLPAAAAPENVNTVDPQTVETIINRYMQKQADAKAAAEGKRRQRAAARNPSSRRSAAT